MKQLCLTIIGLLFTIIVSPQEVETTRMASIIKKAVVTVYAEDENNNVFASGSGFFITQSGIAITNFHVLEGASHGSIKDCDGRLYKITSIIDYNAETDLVKFKIDAPLKQFTALKVSGSIPEQGAFVLSYSTPLGVYEGSLSTGVISATRTYDRYGEVLQMTAAISHGSSGSPVLDKDMNVVGVSTFGDVSGQSLNFAVSSKQILKLSRNLNIPVCDMVKNKYETQNVRKAIAAWNSDNPEEADRCLSDEISKNPKNHLAHYYKGLYTCRRGDLSGISHIFEACNLDTTNINYFISLSTWVRNEAIYEVYNSTGVTEETINISANIAYKCFALDPNRSEALTNYAYVLFNSAKNKSKNAREEELELSKKIISLAIDIAPDTENYNIRSQIYTHLGEDGKALNDIDAAIRLDPTYTHNYITKASIEIYKLDLLNEGIADIDRALAKEKDFKTNNDLADAYALRGDGYASRAFKLGRNAALDYINARTDYKKAYSISNDNRYAQYDMEFYQKVKQYAQQHNGYFPNYQGSDICYIYIEGDTSKFITPQRSK